MFLGVLLLLLGALMLLGRLNIIYGDIGDWIAPVAIIALGVHFLSRKYRSGS